MDINSGSPNDPQFVVFENYCDRMEADMKAGKMKFETVQRAYQDLRDLFDGRLKLLNNTVKKSWWNKFW